MCGAKWRGEVDVCPLDGGALVEEDDPMLERALGERYWIASRIAAGGTGAVYQGRDMDARRDVAIKILAPSLSGDPAMRARFLREASAARRIEHPNVIQILDAGETEDDLVYIVMELLRGDPLSHLLLGGALPAARATRIAIQVASALAAAHRLDVIHRDVKPSCVFIRDPGPADEVKVLDFGAARVAGEVRLTADEAVLGTPEYMAPEQARGAVLSVKADVYALGCVTYAMLTGRPPFTGSIADIVVQHVRRAPEPPSRHVPTVPPTLDAAVLRALEKDPSRRPDADAFRAELEAALA
jgi:serine/threonine-protein kinase